MSNCGGQSLATPIAQFMYPFRRSNQRFFFIWSTFNQDHLHNHVCQFALDRNRTILACNATQYYAIPYVYIYEYLYVYTIQGNLTQHTDAILTQVLTTAAQVVVATGSTCSYNAIVHLHLLIYLLWSLHHKIWVKICRIVGLGFACLALNKYYVSLSSLISLWLRWSLCELLLLER